MADLARPELWVWNFGVNPWGRTRSVVKLRRRTRLNCTCIFDADQTYVLCDQMPGEEQSVTYMVLCCRVYLRIARTAAERTELRGPAPALVNLRSPLQVLVSRREYVYLSPHVSRGAPAARSGLRLEFKHFACWLLPVFIQRTICMRYSTESTAFIGGCYLRRARHGASIGAVHPFPGSPPPRAGARS